MYKIIVYLNSYHHGYESTDVALLHHNLSQQEKGTFTLWTTGGAINTCQK